MAKTNAMKVKTITEHAGKTIALPDATILYAFDLSRDAGVVSVATYNGKTSLDIRRFYLGDDDEWHPTSKGIKIPAEAASAFLDALHDEHNAILHLLA